MVKAAWRSTPFAILGVGCYFLSLFLDNLWREAPNLIWLAPDGLDTHSFAVRLYTFSAMAMRAIYAIIIACTVTWAMRVLANSNWALGGLVLGALSFWILAIAETFSVAEYVLCKMVADEYTINQLSALWQIEGQTSACERLGGPALAWVLPAITTLALVWVLWRAYQVWKTMKPTVGT